MKHHRTNPKATTIFLSGGCLGFFWKNYFNAQADRFFFIDFALYNVAEQKFMLSPARKKNIALLNLSSQCIVFMEKYISVPHDRKTKFCFSSHEKKIFWLKKYWHLGKDKNCPHSFFSSKYKKEPLACMEHGTLQTRCPLWSMIRHCGL